MGGTDVSDVGAGRLLAWRRDSPSSRVGVVTCCAVFVQVIVWNTSVAKARSSQQTCARRSDAALAWAQALGVPDAVLAALFTTRGFPTR